MYRVGQIHGTAFFPQTLQPSHSLLHGAEVHWCSNLSGEHSGHHHNIKYVCPTANCWLLDCAFH